MLVLVLVRLLRVLILSLPLLPPLLQRLLRRLLLRLLLLRLLLRQLLQLHVRKVATSKCFNAQLAYNTNKNLLVVIPTTKTSHYPQCRVCWRMSSSGRSGTLQMLVTSTCNGSAATAPAGELSPVCLSSWSSSRCSNPVTRGRSLDARREHDQGHVGGGILPSVRRSRTPPPAGRRPHVGGGIPPALRDCRTPPLARSADRRLLAPPGASWRRPAPPGVEVRHANMFQKHCLRCEAIGGASD